MSKVFGKVLFGLFVTMVIGVIVFLVISINEYNEKIKEYKTPNEWVLEAVKEDFFTIREEDEIYIYEIREMLIENSNHEDELENYGEYTKLFYVKMIDDSFNVEEYLVLISYNTDKSSLWAYFRRGIGVRNELIGLEHIVYVDVDEL